MIALGRRNDPPARCCTVVAVFAFNALYRLSANRSRCVCHGKLFSTLSVKRLMFGLR